MRRARVDRRAMLRASAALTIGAATLGRGRSAMAGTAAANGFFVPAESAPHARTFMQWPISRRVYPEPDFLEETQDSIAELANVIAEFEPVVMLMAVEHAFRARLKLGTAVEIWDIPTEDLWCRDSGPLFVVDGQGGLAVTHLNFNGWGNKQIHRRDGLVATRVADRLGLRLFDNGLVGEGGGVELDGDGTAIAHESSWVNPNRNPGARVAVEALMREALGVDRVVWAPGVAGEDITDYHIDSLARFVEPGRVVIQLPDQPDPDDPWSVAGFQTLAALEAATDARGRRLKVERVPEPAETRVRSRDFVASYANHYVCNGAVILGTFGDREADARAVETLSRVYPDREVVTLNADPLGEIGGGVHCATQQQPKP